MFSSVGLWTPPKKPYIPNLVVRGFNQGMRACIQGFNGGANISVVSRITCYTNVGFNRCRVVIPVFQTIGNPLVDTLLAGVISFQVGILPTVFQGYNGIPNRTPFLFAGANFVTYDNATWNPASGCIVSDWLDLPGTGVLPGRFEVWIAAELPAGVYNNALPFSITGTNYIERYYGQIFSGVSQIVGLGGGSNVALTLNNLAKMGSTQTGVSGIFTPASIEYMADDQIKHVTAIGDSLTFGNNEGQAGSDGFGDRVGSAMGNAGAYERGIYENCGVNMLNIGKGSDGNKFLITPLNWQYRRELLVRSNPTHVILANGHNDATPIITVNGWAALTNYNRYDVVSSSSAIYMCDQAGQSGSVAISGFGDAIVDGTCLWYRVGGFPAGAIPRGYAVMFAQYCSVCDQIRAALPGVKIIGATTTPDATSVNNWADIAGQTPNSSWGVGGSRVGLFNDLIRSMRARLGLSSYIDVPSKVEFNYVGQSGQWDVNLTPIANWLTNDGTHYNSRGAYYGQGAIGPLNIR